jgi:conjugal transfer mating pair stabilization protein TraG
VLISGMLNKVESGLVDIVHTSGSAKDYQNSAGGLGFNALMAATGQPLTIKDEYAMQSLDRYNKDCLFFELQRPGTTISVEQIKNQATDFTTIWNEAASPAIYTVYYDDLNKAGVTATCAEAWQWIAADLAAPASYERALKQICPAIGFDVEDALQYQRCQGLIGDYADHIHNGLAGSTQNFLRQSAMARALEYTLLRLSPDSSTIAQLNRHAMTSGIGMGIAANEWLPITRAVFTAICIGMVPFILLMFPTGLVNKALGLIAGFFIWLACWGVCDAIMHVLANRIAYNVMEAVRQSNLGYTAIMLWPSYGQKALAQFGMMRTGSMMMAALITGALVKFGGHALAIMAQSHAGHLQSLGANAARGTETLEGAAQNIEAWRNSVPTWTNANKFDFATDTAARSALRMGQTGGHIAAMNQAGGAAAYEEMIRKSTAASDLTHGMGGAGQFDKGLGLVSSQAYAGGAANVAGTEEKRQALERVIGRPVSQEQATMMEKYGGFQAVGPQGQQLNVRRDADGQQWMDVTTPHGAYTLSQSGDLANAKINTFSLGKKLSNTAALREQAVSRIQSEVAWNELWKDHREFAKNHGISSEIARSAQESIKRELGKIVEQDESIRNSLSDSNRTSIQGWIQGRATPPPIAGAVLGVLGIDGEIGGRASADKSFTRDTTSTESFSAKEHDAFKRAYDQAVHNVVRDQLSSNYGSSWVKDVTETAGRKETQALACMATTDQSVSDSTSRILDRDLVSYVSSKYGIGYEDAIRKINQGYDGLDADGSVVASRNMLGRNILDGVAARKDGVEAGIDSPYSSPFTRNVDRQVGGAGNIPDPSRETPAAPGDELSFLIDQGEAKLSIQNRTKNLTPVPEALRDKLNEPPVEGDVSDKIFKP